MKVAIISDTHCRHDELVMPEADMLIHCGDFSNGGDRSISSFLSWFTKQDYKYKILIAGNHDIRLEELGKEKIKEICLSFDERIIYLKDESITIEGLKFYGSPYTVLYRNWAFMKEDDELIKVWDKIPLDTNILITHGPQKGTFDRIGNNGFYEHLGSRSLERKMIELKNLKYHFFGHIHGETGIKEIDEFQKYVSINASSLYEYNQDTSRLKDVIVIDL